MRPSWTWYLALASLRHVFKSAFPDGGCATIAALHSADKSAAWLLMHARRASSFWITDPQNLLASSRQSGRGAEIAPLDATKPIKKEAAKILYKGIL
jgi:hypothetical protein